MWTISITENIFYKNLLLQISVKPDIIIIHFMNSFVIDVPGKADSTAVKAELEDMLQQHLEHYFIASVQAAICNDYLIYHIANTI